MISTLIFATIAGVLSVLSPCVLPLVPIVLATAIGKHRYGHLALAAGLAGSFVAIGMFVALLGFGIGLDLDFFRSFGALLMIGLGVVLILPSMQVRFATAAGPIGNWTERRFGGQQGDGWRGQFVVGLLLGTVWSPLRRSDPRRRITDGSAGREPHSGLPDHGGLRSWGRRAAIAPRPAVA